MNDSADFLAVVRSNQPSLNPGTLVAEGIRFTYTREGKAIKIFEKLSTFGASWAHILKAMGYKASDSTSDITLRFMENKLFSSRDKSMWIQVGTHICNWLGYSNSSSKKSDTHITVYLVYRHIDSDMLESFQLRRMVDTNNDRLLKTWVRLNAIVKDLQAIPSSSDPRRIIQDQICDKV